MPDEEHIRILKQDNSTFNKWREAHKKVVLDLSGIVEKEELKGHFKGKNDLGPANLQNADLSNANLEATHFAQCDLTGADFKEAHVLWASFKCAKYTHLTKNLETVTVNDFRPNPPEFPDARHLDTIPLPWDYGRFGWEKLRSFGKLPLFNASYIAIVSIIVFLYFHQAYNEGIGAIRASAESVAANPDHSWSDAAIRIRDTLLDLRISWTLPCTLVGSVCLAIASTIYEIWCPDRIKDFSREVWCHQNQKPLVQYLPLSWVFLKRRLFCGFLYIVGGILTLLVILYKLGQAFLYIVHTI